MCNETISLILHVDQVFRRHEVSSFHACFRSLSRSAGSCLLFTTGSSLVVSARRFRVEDGGDARARLCR